MSGDETHEQRIQRVLTIVYQRNGFEVPDHKTPLAELMAKEERVGREEMEDVLELIDSVRSESFSRLMDYFYDDGPHPGVVLRRVFAVAYALRPDLIAHMTHEEIGMMFNETKAASSWRLNQVFSEYLKKNGFKAVRAPGQKTEETRRRCSNAQMGNTNRRNGGKKKKKEK